uniref:Uncharacterized protein n=1 Tax=Anguilla anguilla TaxID=7936 RepID=A0A0E9U7B5_ANGAN
MIVAVRPRERLIVLANSV